MIISTCVGIQIFMSEGSEYFKLNTITCILQITIRHMYILETSSVSKCLHT